MDTLGFAYDYLESIEKYKLLAENTVECIWLFDLANNCYKYISPSIFNLRGVSVEEAMKEKLEDCLTPESMEILKAHSISRLPRFLAGDRSENVTSSIDEYQQYCKDGTIKTIEISTKFILNEETKSIDVLGVSRDITERKKTEQKLYNDLKEKEAVLKSLFRNAQKSFRVDKGRIYCFGKFSVYGESSNFPVKWRTAKSEELFAYLLQNSGTEILKWKICEALWPESNVEKIDIHLHTTLYKMKKVLDSAKIKIDIKFNNGCYRMSLRDIYTDIGEFNFIVDSDIAMTEDTIEKYEKAFSLYKNDYLEGNDYIWSLFQREKYSKKCLKLGNDLVQYYLKRNDHAKAERILRTILERSPLDESAHEMLLKMYFNKKDRTAFITHYNAMQELLKAELEIEPSDSIKALYNSILCS